MNDPLSDIKNEDKNQNNIPKKNTNIIIKIILFLLTKILIAKKILRK